jgi:sarcosine oxidase subunit delta
MKLMPCPLNGLRNISEFICGGEVVSMPDPISGSDHDWADYLFIENNIKGHVREWWMHVPTSYWFIAERNTETEEIIKTYPVNELFNQRIEFKENK